MLSRFRALLSGEVSPLILTSPSTLHLPTICPPPSDPPHSTLPPSTLHTPTLHPPARPQVQLTGPICFQCTCPTFISGYASCRGRALRYHPTFPAGTVHASLAKNSLAVVEAVAFADARASLEHIDLSSNAVASVAPDTFAGLRSLHQLDMGRNLLAAVPAGLFDDNTRLAHVGLAHNLLTALEPGLVGGGAARRGFPALLSLSLAHNRLASIHGDALNASALEVLELQDNRLVSQGIASEAFAALTSLRRLLLTRNRITTVSAAWSVTARAPT